VRPRNAHLCSGLAAGLVALILGAAAPACGGSDETPSRAAEPKRSGPDPTAFINEPTVDGLLRLLAQDHRAARRALGRHRLSYTADFSLVPPPQPRPEAGEQVPSAREVHDVLLLEWAGDDDREPAIHLRQGPEEEASREIIILGEDAYSRLPYRGWLRRELDSELHWAWLDDAEHAVYDLVAFVQPQLEISVTDADEDVVTLNLQLAPERAPTPPSEGLEAWRADAEFTAIEGTLVVDREHGLWRSAELTAEYRLRDDEGRTLTGHATLSAQRELLPTLSVAPPEASAPFPERIRYEDERRRLLDGVGR